MQPISNNQIDDDMRQWFGDLQKARPQQSGIPQPLQIKTETINLTKTQAEKFGNDPRGIIQQVSSTNAANADADQTFRR